MIRVRVGFILMISDDAASLFIASFCLRLDKIHLFNVGYRVIEKTLNISTRTIAFCIDREMRMS